MTQIVSRLDSASQYFLDARDTVADWVWPFSLLATPLYWLYVAFYYLAGSFGQFNDWLALADAKLSSILSYANIQSYFKYWFDAASNAWTWVWDATYNVWQIADSWWEAKQTQVQGWIADAVSLAATLPSQANAWLAALQSAWDSFAPKIPAIDGIIAWWGNWWGNILAQLGIWWNSRLLEIQGLINSAFTAREQLWAGWQDIRQQVLTFFADPVEFLWQRFADWFLGPEV